MPANILQRPTRPVSGAYPRPGGSLGQITRDAFFQYTVTFGVAPLAFTVGTETFSLTIPIQSDAHFICVMSEYDNSLQAATANNGAAGLVAGGATVFLTDTSAPRHLGIPARPANTLFRTGPPPP